MRPLSRNSAHRKALLRNLVTSLITNESITTTWPKAKEAQRMAEKLIALGKKNTEASQNSAKGMVFTPEQIIPRVFGELRERYATRNGGFTRVLRLEPNAVDQSPTAMLELIDSPRDMRFAMTAMTLANREMKGEGLNEITALNVKKVTQYRKDGEESLMKQVRKLIAEREKGEKSEKRASRD